MSELSVIVPANISIVSQDEWNTMNPSIKDSAVNIAKSIKAAHTKIAKAKEKAENAPNIKGGFLGFGRQSKINSALAESQVLTNEAVTDLAELIQQSTRLTIQSVIKARDMQKALAYLAINGIRDVNGRVETLSSECADSINIIIESAQGFLQQQADFSERIDNQEAKDQEQDTAIIRIEETLQECLENSIRQEQRLSDLYTFNDRNQTSIGILDEAISEYKDKNDEILVELENRFRESLESNRKSDEEQRNRLREEYNTKIQKLKLAQLIISLSIGAIALAALICSIVL